MNKRMNHYASRSKITMAAAAEYAALYVLVERGLDHDEVCEVLAGETFDTWYITEMGDAVEVIVERVAAIIEANRKIRAMAS